MIEAVARTALILGTAYALVGVAVATVAIAARTLHLAVGPILVVAVLSYASLLSLGLAAPVAAVVAVVVATALSTLLEPLVLRPLTWRSARGRRPATDPAAPRLVEPTRTVGVQVRWVVGLAVAAAVLETASARWFATRPLRPPTILGGEVVATGDPTALLVAVGGGVVAVGLLLWGLFATGGGRRLRLVGGSSAAAELAGVSPARIRASALAVSGAAAALAGLLIAPLVGIGVGQAGGLTLRAVAAAVILGVGGPLRAVAAGVLLGVVEAVAQGLIPAVPAEVWIGLVAVSLLCLRGGETDRAWGRAW